MENSEKNQKVVQPARSAAEKAHAERAKKTVIVVGASSGIGYETALRLVGRGYCVVNIPGRRAVWSASKIMPPT